MERERGTGPLEGVHVLDVGTYGVGPGAAAIMAFLGADVVRIENPHGDAFFDNPPLINGVGASYINANMHKRIIKLDLKSPEGLRGALALARWTDVLMENRLGVLEKLGLGYEELSGINPDIVYVSSPGFGRSGPYAGRPALDSYVQAMSGFASTQGVEGGDPEFFRVFGFLDHTASTFMVQAAILGLIQRGRTGRGLHVDASHLASSVFLQITRIADFFATGENPPRLGSASSDYAPSQTFRCLDDKFINISCPDDECWATLCQVLNATEIVNDRRLRTARDRLENRAALGEVIQRHIGEAPAWWWLLRLRQSGVPCGPLNLPEEMLSQQDLQDQCLVRVTTPWGDVWHADNPWQFSETPCPDITDSPETDEDELTAMLGALEREA